MPSTNIPIRVIGIRLDGESLLLDVEDVSDEEWSIKGTPEDLPAFKKLFGKTMPARLVLGAEEEPAQENEEKLRALVAELEHKLAESAVSTAGPNHPLAQLARGALTVIAEQAEARLSSNVKSVDAAVYGAIHKAAADALAKLERLVGPAKTNGQAQAELPAPAAS